jgi:hypothetical protein
MEAQAAGWKAWPNLVAGIAGMWLHPAIWPAESRAQRQQRAATMAITVAAACWFLTHAATELDTLLSTGVARSWPMSVCTLLMLLGLVLVAPRPRLTFNAATTVLRRVVSRFAAPAILGAGVVAGVLATAGTLPGPILVSASVTSGHLDLLSAASGAGVLVLTSVFVGTLRDIRHLPPAD